MHQARSEHSFGSWVGNNDTREREREFDGAGFGAGFQMTMMRGGFQQSFIHELESVEEEMVKQQAAAPR